jgi:hypothetical protein
MDDAEILAAARVIMDRDAAIAKLRKAQDRPGRPVMLVFKEAMIGANSHSNPRTKPLPEVVYEVPYELAVTFVVENKDVN